MIMITGIHQFKLKVSGIFISLFSGFMFTFICSTVILVCVRNPRVVPKFIFEFSVKFKSVTKKKNKQKTCRDHDCEAMCTGPQAAHDFGAILYTSSSGNTKRSDIL